MEYPKPVSRFLECLARLLGNDGVKVEVEPTRGGRWWIDLRGQRHLAVEWHPERGFGLNAEEKPHYGEGAAEIFRSPDLAARRATQILARAAASSPTGLSELRELFEFTQVEIADRLHKGQPAIAQLEKGRDSKIETINAFIEALGGRMEIRAVFPGGHLPLFGRYLEDNSHDAPEPARPARARA